MCRNWKQPQACSKALTVHLRDNTINGFTHSFTDIHVATVLDGDLALSVVWWGRSTGQRLVGSLVDDDALLDARSTPQHHHLLGQHCYDHHQHGTQGEERHHGIVRHPRCLWDAVYPTRRWTAVKTQITYFSAILSLRLKDYCRHFPSQTSIIDSWCFCYLCHCFTFLQFKGVDSDPEMLWNSLLISDWKCLEQSFKQLNWLNCKKI